MHLRRPVLCALALAFASTVVLAASPGEMPLTTSSEEAKALFVKARDLMGNLETEEVVRLCDQAIEKDPSFAMAYVLRGAASGSLAYRENVNKAAALADRVSPGEKLWIQAEKALSDGKPVEARKPLDALVRMFPGDKHVRLRAAMYSMNVSRDMTQAAAHLQKATTIDPSFAPAYNLLGYVQSDRGNYAGAEKAFQKYIALLPDGPNPYDSYAELLMKMGRHDESIAQYKKALEKDASFYPSLAGIGNNLVLKGEFDEARQAFEQQREKAPDLDGRLDALDNTAKSYVAEGKIDRAVETYGAAVEKAKAGSLPARAAAAALDASFVLTQTGDLAGARSWADRAENALSEGELPVAVKERYQRGTRLARAKIHAAAGEVDRARAEIDAVRPAIQQAGVPSEGRALNAALGTLALHEKRYADAARYFGQAGDDNPYVLFQRATAMEAAGQSAQATPLFKKVADWNANDLGYVMVREEAREKATAAPVATAGRKK